MINKRWNINAILCGKCDKDIVDLQNIFDVLYVDENNTASFNIVTFISALGCDEQKFGLYYYIEKLEEGNEKVAYVCRSMHERKEEESGGKESDYRRSTVEGVTIKSTRFIIDEFCFPGEGNYELKVYKYDNDKVQSCETENDGSPMQFVKDDNLVTIYPFKVVKS